MKFMKSASSAVSLVLLVVLVAAGLTALTADLMADPPPPPPAAVTDAVYVDQCTSFVEFDANELCYDVVVYAPFSITNGGVIYGYVWDPADSAWRVCTPLNGVPFAGNCTGTAQLVYNIPIGSAFGRAIGPDKSPVWVLVKLVPTTGDPVTAEEWVYWKQVP